MYTPTRAKVFEILIGNFSYAFSDWRSCSHGEIDDIETPKHIAIKQSDQSKFCCFMEIIFIWQDVFNKFGIDYKPRLHYNPQTNFSNRITIAYSIKIFFVTKKC